MRQDHRVNTHFILGGAMLFGIIVILLALTNDLSGNVTSQVRIVNATPINCTFGGSVGHNLISIPCITSADPRNAVIDDVGMWAMYQYVPGTTDRWRVHNPNLPPWVISDLEFLSRRVGYVLILNQSRSYQTSGLSVSSTDIPIIAGWTLVGYPSLNETGIVNATLSINDTVNVIRSYDATGATYRYYYPATQSGDLINLTPGQGYWVNGTGSDAWTVFA